MTTSEQAFISERIHRLGLQAESSHLKWQDARKRMTFALAYLQESQEHGRQQHIRWAQTQLNSAMADEQQAAADTMMLMRQVTSAQDERARQMMDNERLCKS